MTERGDFNCPNCDSSEIYREGDSGFQCESCGEGVHEIAGKHWDLLQDLKQSGDDEISDLGDSLASLEVGE